MTEDPCSAAICHLPPAICHLPSGICHLPWSPQATGRELPCAFAGSSRPRVRSVAGQKARPRCMMNGAGQAGLEFSRAAHAVAAVEAAVAGAAADGESAAIVAGRRVALEVGELAVLLAQTVGEGSFRNRYRRLGGSLLVGPGTHDGLGVLEIGDGGRANAVDLEHGSAGRRRFNSSAPGRLGALASR